jgi:hypothetical protein
LRNNSGGLAMFTAIRRSRMSNFAAVARHSGRGGVRFPRIALPNKGRALAGCTPGAASIKLQIWNETLPSGKN